MGFMDSGTKRKLGSVFVRVGLPLLLVSVFVVTSSGAFGASGKKDDVAAQMHGEASRAFKMGQYNNAARIWMSAYDRDPYPPFLYNIGRCQQELGRHLDAVKSYRDYLQATQNADDRTVVEQKIRVLMTVVESTHVALQIESRPSGAMFYIDEVLQGTTPFDGWLEPSEGVHRLRLTLVGHQPVERDVALEKGTKLALNFDLVAQDAPGHIVLRGGCEGAAVKLNDISVGSFPLDEPLDVPVGRHTVQVQCRDHIPFLASVDITAGATATLKVKRVRPPLPPPPVRKNDPFIPMSAWIATSVGAVALITGGVFYELAAQAADDAETPAEKGDREKYDEYRRKADQDILLVNLCLAATAAALGSAGVATWMHHRQPEAEEGHTAFPTTTITPMDGGITGFVTLRF